MESLLLITILFYGCSSVAYIGYLFWQKNSLHTTGYWVLAVGFGVHTALLGHAFVQTGFLPVRNLHETLSIAGWSIAGFFFIFNYRFKLRILGIVAAPLATGAVLAAARLNRVPGEVPEFFNSFWLVIHVMAIFIGEAAFAMACGVGLLYLLQEHAIKNKHRGFFFKRLPSLELLDSTGYTCLIGGFAMLTFGLISGLLYAHAAWGRFWSWDPKEVWSGITWLVYAVLLHGRLTVGWRGRKSAIMAIIGFATLLFTFFGVNFLLKGHHGGFTRW